MPTPDPAAPNIVLVTLDTVRADHLPLYGYARGRTPNLDAFAAQATVYDHAYSPADMTLPSHASIFTGLYASWHGAHYITGSRMLARALDSRFETLAERVRARGYATAAVVANHGHLAPAFGLGQGFDYYDARPPLSRCRPLPGQWLRRVVETAWCGPGRSWRFEVPYRRAHAITDEAMGVLTRLESADRPFFLFVNYMDAHRPYFPPPPYDALFPGKDPTFTAADYLEQERRINSGEGKLGDRERENLLSQYDGGISYLDAELGRLFDDLAARGLLERTLVVITADHGEGFGEHDLIDHGVSVFQELIHVPLLVRTPGGSIARRVATPVSTLDLFSTILEAAGVAPSATAQGIPLDQSGRDPDRVIFSESFTNDLFLSWSPRFRRIQRAAISGGEKFILATDGQQAFYDLSTDPGERDSLALQEPAMSAALEARLAAWLEGAPKGSEVIPAVDSPLQARLRTLGYVR
jgi:arylsulfatase A-like enzyme